MGSEGERKKAVIPSPLPSYSFLAIYLRTYGEDLVVHSFRKMLRSNQDDIFLFSSSLIRLHLLKWCTCALFSLSCSLLLGVLLICLWLFLVGKILSHSWIRTRILGGLVLFSPSPFTELSPFLNLRQSESGEKCMHT